MIVGKIGSKGFENKLSSKIAKALEIAAETDFNALQEGEYQIEGDSFYYAVQKYKTKDPEKGRLEAHRRYIDVQFIASGCEIIGYAPLEGLAEQTEYDEEKDLIFYQNTEFMSDVVLTQGMYAVLYPNDAHAPGITAAERCDVCKVVFKIKI